MQIVLYTPEIPPNTGSVARLCAATGTRLNLIEPLGFSLDDRYLRRAGLDYWPSVDLKVWPDWETFAAGAGGRLVLSSARRGEPYHRFRFAPGDLLVLGPESTGLPPDILDRYPDHVRIPIWGAVRSLNLANAASILLYEAFRQTGELDGK
jgi:tRNA (cytidine/uridine-2'-O-)-methyltransferase